MKTYFQITPLNLCIQTDYSFPLTAETGIFLSDTISNSKLTLECNVKFTDKFHPLLGKILYSDQSMIVMDINGIEHRIYLLPNTKEPYAFTKRSDYNHVEVVIDVQAAAVIKWDRNFMGMFALEHYCLSERAFLLHASFIIFEKQAIVFTAPSGNGKSTQADLWNKYQNAKIINGDRTLLFYKNGNWYAGGFPVCGSSSHCLNESAPVQAIIYLEKSPENLIIRLSPIQALKAVYSQAFINKWNPCDCKLITEYIELFIQTVPIYKYFCTKNRAAVEFLKNHLHTYQR